LSKCFTCVFVSFFMHSFVECWELFFGIFQHVVGTKLPMLLRSILCDMLHDMCIVQLFSLVKWHYNWILNCLLTSLIVHLLSHFLHYDCQHKFLDTHDEVDIKLDNQALLPTQTWWWDAFMHSMWVCVLPIDSCNFIRLGSTSLNHQEENTKWLCMHPFQVSVLFMSQHNPT
jgi:hypothetical protein